MSRRDAAVPARMRFPVPPNALPALEPLLAGSLWSNWVERGWVFPLEDVCSAVRYVRFKPGVSCRMLVLSPTATPLGQPPAGFLLHLYTDAGRARTAFEKVAARPTLVAEPGFQPFLSETHAVVAVPYPNDVEVPGLRHVYVPRRLRRALSRILAVQPGQKQPIDEEGLRLMLLAYKPGRRAVFRVESRLREGASAGDGPPPLHVKVESPKIYPRSHEHLAAIHAATVGQPGWRVPKPIGTDDQCWLTASEWIDGRPAFEILRDAEQAAKMKKMKMMRQTGRALAGLHRCSPDADALAGPENEPARVERLAQDVGRLLPDERLRVERLAERLALGSERLLEASEATLHGDFHLEQVISAQGCTVLVDLDGARPGHPAIDLGTLRAHMIERGAPDELHEALLDGYGGWWVAENRDAVELATAIGVFRRASVPFRRLDIDWPSRTRRYLQKVEELLQGIEGC